MRLIDARAALWAPVFAMLAGCATVRSTEQPADTVASGMTYYLPKREIKVSADRKLLKKADLDKALAAKKADLVTANTELKAATAAVKTATDRLASSTVAGDAAATVQVKRELAIAKADEEIAKEKIGKLEVEITSLEASILAVTNAQPGSCSFQYSAKMELLPIVADTSLRLVADPSHNVFRDDDTKLAVTSGGLLSSANAVATDRTGDILVEIASAIAGAGGGVPVMNPMNFLEENTPPAVSCEELPTKFADSFDPASTADLAKVNGELYNANFPFRIAVPSLGTGVTVNGTSLGREGKNGALFYRSAVPQAIQLRQCSTTLQCSTTVLSESVPIDASVVMLPQIGPVSYIPMRSSAFVKTVDDVTFENGMLISWNASRPSEVLEVVRLPVKLLKAVVSVPAELIKLRVDLSDQQKGLVEAQQTQMAAQQRFAIIKACVDAAGADRDATMACFED